MLTFRFAEVSRRPKLQNFEFKIIRDRGEISYVYRVYESVGAYLWLSLESNLKENSCSKGLNGPISGYWNRKYCFCCKFLFVKGRLDCDSQRVFYATLEATQTRRTDLWVFTLLLSESRLFCVFLFLNDGHLTAGSPLDRCVHQLAIGFE